MFRFEELEIWKLAIEYAKDCYKIANDFPTKETYSLADQLRRASVSVSNNIAEGSAFGDVKFRSYLDITIGSTLETINIISFAVAIGYIKAEKQNLMYGEAEKLIRKVRSFKNSLK